MTTNIESNAFSSDFSDLVDNNDSLMVSLKRFMNQYELARDDKKTNTNIICNDYQYKKRFYVPLAGVSQLMSHLLQCYEAGITLRFLEVFPNTNSYEIGSGLSFDFVFITNESSVAFEDAIAGFLKILFEDVLIKVLRMPKTGRETHHCILLGSPKSIYIESLYKYKQVYKIIIPSIQVGTLLKKFIFDRLWNSAALRELFKKKTNVSFRTAFDYNTRSIPNCLIGSCTIKENTYLELMSIQKASIEDGTTYEGISIVSNPSGLFKNLVYECSLNYEMPAADGGIIRKRVYLPRSNVIKMIEDKMSNSDEQMAIAYDNALVEISQLSIYDDVFDQFKKILDMISDDRIANVEHRADIISALASRGNKYHCIALWFCRNRCKTMTLDEFNQLWFNAINKKDVRNDLKSLRYWAGLDSPSEMRRFLEKQVRQMLLRDVKGMLSGGSIGHTNIASYLEFMFKNVFATTVIGKSTCWYEFVTPSTKNQDRGQLYKWKFVGSHPVSLSEYISSDLAEITQKVLLELSQEINTAKDDDRKKYLKSLKSTFLRSIKQIFNTPFKRNVIEATADKFADSSLVKRMDKTKHIMGVGNGVLEFNGPEVRLLDHYHSYPITMYTETEYIPYDPENEYIKTVYKMLHSLFPANEMDAFDFIMYYLSTSLDWHPKESLFLIITGGGSNGKSILIEFFRETIGEMYARRMPLSFITEQTRTKSAAADPAMMEMKYARFVNYSESERNERANIARIKELTGGDTMAGRQLYGEQENFKPNCNHLLATNHHLRIESTEHAVWRRFLTYKFKMTFKENPDPENEFERMKDSKFINMLKDDKRYHAGFLSILTHYRSKLYSEYDGQILKVPHPTIKEETNIYRQQEDIYERFIVQRVFYKENKPVQTMDEFLTIFRNYYRNENGERLKIKNEELKYLFLNSSIQKFIKFNPSGVCVLHDVYTLDEAVPIIQGSMLYKEYLKTESVS